MHRVNRERDRSVGMKRTKKLCLGYQRKEEFSRPYCDAKVECSEKQRSKLAVTELGTKRELQANPPTDASLITDDQINAVFGRSRCQLRFLLAFHSRILAFSLCIHSIFIQHRSLDVR